MRQLRSWITAHSSVLVVTTTFAVGAAIGGGMVASLLSPDAEHVPEWVIAIGTLLLAFVTFVLALVGIAQIKALRDQQRKWTTLQACDRYDSDAVINQSLDVLQRRVRDKAEPSDDAFHAVRKNLELF